MTWSAPMTAVAGNIFTAAQFNQYVRDNLLETGPAKITAPGQILVGTAANALAVRTISEGYTAAGETSASTSYTDLTTAGPSVTVTTGTQALVGLYCLSKNSASGFTAMSYAVSGASSITADDSRCSGGATSTTGFRYSSFLLITGLTPGSNVFTAKYRVTSGTGTWQDRKISVVPL